MQIFHPGLVVFLVRLDVPDKIFIRLSRNQVKNVEDYSVNHAAQFYSLRVVAL